MTGLTRRDTVTLQYSAADPWQIAGLGDMNGDWNTDFVWRNYGDGRLAAWFMKDTYREATPNLTPPELTDLSWRLVGVADWLRDGVRDGKPDLIWKHSDPTRDNLAVWYMDGIVTAPNGTVYMNPPRMANPDWKLVGVK
jgi:hypothetical protein